MTFSPRIQNFIDNSGKEVAIQRFAQIEAYVDNYNKKVNGIIYNLLHEKSNFFNTASFTLSILASTFSGILTRYSTLSTSLTNPSMHDVHFNPFVQFIQPVLQV